MDILFQMNISVQYATISYGNPYRVHLVNTSSANDASEDGLKTNNPTAMCAHTDAKSFNSIDVHLTFTPYYLI